MNLNEAFDRIKYLTGKSDNDLIALAWETGYALIEHVEEGNEEIAAKIKRSRIFWNWYNKQFGQLTREFLEYRNDWESWQKDHVWHTYTEFIGTFKVPEKAQSSYCYLVAEILEPIFRKQKKAGGILSPSKI